MVNTVLPEEDEQEESARAAYARAVGSRLPRRAQADAALAPGGRGHVGPGVQGVGAGRLRTRRARHLGAEAAAPGQALRRPVDQLLPQDDDATRWGPNGEGNGNGGESPGRARRQLRPWDGHDKVTIDLTKLNSVSGPERDLLRRFLSMIQVQRQDFNGRMITIRAEDLRAIACLFGVTPDAMSRRLDELGLRVIA